jgi:hypothetical protein
MTRSGLPHQLQYLIKIKKSHQTSHNNWKRGSGNVNGLLIDQLFMSTLRLKIRKKTCCKKGRHKTHRRNLNNFIKDQNLNLKKN